MDVQQQHTLVSGFVRWLLEATQPPEGWQEASVEIKPAGDQVYVRLAVIAPGNPNGMAGALTPGSQAFNNALALQESSARAGAGSWLSALVLARPKNDLGGVAGDARFNFDFDPGAIAADDGELTGQQLVDHLTRYPRRPDAIPQWMRDRITGAGLRIPT